MPNSAPLPVPPDPPPEAKKWSVLWEDIVVVLSIPVLWLFVLRLKGKVYLAIGCATLVLLVIVLLRRIKRINEAAERRRANDREHRPGP